MIKNEFYSPFNITNQLTQKPDFFDKCGEKLFLIWGVKVPTTKELAELNSTKNVCPLILNYLKDLKKSSLDTYINLIWIAEKVFRYQKIESSKEGIIWSPNIRCLAKAADNVGLSWKYFPNMELFEVNGLIEDYRYFHFTKTPFNTAMVEKIVKDKAMMYELLSQTELSKGLPKTLWFLDPSPQSKLKYPAHQNSESIEDIASKIELWLKYPVIIKMNQGFRGINVYLCRNKSEVITAASEIFNKNQQHSDYILVAQEYIPIKKEYRVIVFNPKIDKKADKSNVVLVYEKSIDNAVFDGNISPLHYDGAEAKLITDTKIIDQLTCFVKSFVKELGIVYCGIDVAESISGELYLIEINSHPGFSIFLSQNDPSILTKMYEHILRTLAEK